MTSRVIKEQIKTDPRVFAFRIVGDSDEKGPNRILCHLSREGHDTLRQQGKEALEKFITESEQMPVSVGAELEFGIFGVNEALESLFQPDQGYPVVMSWQAEMNVQSILLNVDDRQVWFKGHFPGLPVLPGVVQLHWAASAARIIYDCPEPPLRVVRLKFKKVVVPPRLLELRLEQTVTGVVRFEVRSQLGVHSQGSMRFAESAQ